MTQVAMHTNPSSPPGGKPPRDCSTPPSSDRKDIAHLRQNGDVTSLRAQPKSPQSSSVLNIPPETPSSLSLQSAAPDSTPESRPPAEPKLPDEPNPTTPTTTTTPATITSPNPTSSQTEDKGPQGSSNGHNAIPSAVESTDIQADPTDRALLDKPSQPDQNTQQQHQNDSSKPSPDLIDAASKAHASEGEDAYQPSEIASEVANEKLKSGDASSDVSSDDPFAGLDDVATMDLHDVSNYTFGIKNEQCKCKHLQGLTSTQISDNLRNNYKERGMRRSVAAVILVHRHKFPHLLLLQRRDGRGEFILPGGRLRPGESNEDGLHRKLASKLTPSPSVSESKRPRPDIGEKLCSWYAIDFDRRYYPYVPAHVTNPREELHIFAVSLPNTFTFAVPNNLQLLAVPIFEVYNNSSSYGDVISAIPPVLSRYHFNYC